MDSDDDMQGPNLPELLESSRQLRADALTARRRLSQVVDRIHASRAIANRLLAEAAASRQRQAADAMLARPGDAAHAPRAVTLLYVSRLAPGLQPDTVATIARAARERNLEDGVTGLLAFDGSRFVQLLEGPAKAIIDLEKRVCRDRRHVDVDVLSLAPSRAGLRFPHWQLGFMRVQPGDDRLDCLCRTHGDAALTLFDDIVPELDPEAGTALPA